MHWRLEKQGVADDSGARVDWRRIETVLLDMDGTLLDLRYDNDFWFSYLPAAYGRASGMGTERARDYIQACTAQQRGTLDFYCLDHWSRLLGLDVAALNSELAHLIRYRPGVEAFLRVARQHRRRLLLVTNSHPAGLRFKLQRTGLADYLDDIFCATDFGHPKEQAGFWDGLTVATGLNLECCLLIDDNLDVLRAGDSAGIGQCLGVTQPDLSRPERRVDPFLPLADFGALTASLEQAGEDRGNGDLVPETGVVRENGEHKI